MKDQEKKGVTNLYISNMILICQLCEQQGYLVFFLLGVFVTVFKEFIAGHSQCSNQDDKLLKVYFTVLVFVQVVHDLFDHSGIIAGLQQKHHGDNGNEC